ncbi:MAG: AAA family ATPase [Candidatus Jordarchaeales archaeon]|nr:AAA family ATPase [Candidatus Jordarchaeia archaeon]
MSAFRLKSLSLRNFLTYEYESLDFVREGMIVFIGGNGTGKTSLFNALRFVLGSNQKDQRYKSWSEFINNRGNARSGWVEAVFEGDGESVKLRREVRRGEAPRFYVDGRRVSADEFKEIVRVKLGVDPDNPLVFVPQGRVDAVKEMEPVKLREFVEELVGLADERKTIDEKEGEFREALREADVLKEDVRMIQERVALLAPEVERWRRRKQLEEKLRRLEEEAVWSRIEEGKARLNELARAESEAAARMEEAYAAFREAAERVERMETERRVAKSRMDEIDKEVGKLREEEAELSAKIKEILRRREKSLEEVDKGKRELEKVERDIEDLRVKIRELENRKAVLEEERMRLTERREKLVEELNNISVEKEKFRGWETEWVAAKADFERAKEKAEASNKNRRMAEDELERVRRKISECARRVAELAEKLEGYDEETLRKRREELRKEKEELIAKRKDTEVKLRGWEEEALMLNKKVSSLEARVPEQVRRLEEEVKKRGMNVEGPLLKLVEVPDEYAEAVEAVLGKELLAFVAFNESDFYVLNELRKKYDAWCTIYLSKGLKTSTLRKIDGDGVVGWLEEVLKFPDEVGGVLRDITRRTLLVKEYRNALALSGKYKRLRFVTLRGDVVEERRGVLRSPYRKPRGLLAVKRLMEELEEAQKNRDLLERELKALDERLSEVRREEGKVEGAIMVLPHWKSLLSEKIRLEDEEKKLREEAEKAREEAEKAREELEKARAKLVEVESRKPKDYVELEEEERRVKDELVKLNQSMKKVEAEYGRAVKEREKALLRLKELEVFGESLSRSIEALMEIVTMGDKEASDATREIKGLEIKAKELLDEKRRLEELIEELLQTLGKEREKMREMGERLGDRRSEVERIRSEVRIVREEVEGLEREAERRGLRKPIKVRPLSEVKGEMAFLEEELAGLADVDEKVTREMEELEERRKHVAKKLGELEEELRGILEELERRKKDYIVKLVGVVEGVEKSVNELLAMVNMKCKLNVRGDYSDAGVEVKLSVKGGPMINVTSVSGGERCFFAIALIAALQKESRVPLVFLDEPSTHLDSENSDRTGRILKEVARERQVLVLVPDKYLEFAKHADQCYGTATKGVGGASIVIPVRIAG